MSGETDGPDLHLQEFQAALQELDRALVENLERLGRMRERIAELEAAMAAGRPLVEVVPAEQTPLLVQLLTESADSLHAFGSRVRRAEARTLYDQGMTMDQIAALFGVSRQRVSALLRESGASAARD